MKSIRATFIFVLLSPLIFSCEHRSKKTDIHVDSLTLKYVVIKTLPHDSKAFTEGLVYDNNKLLESTGLNDQSWIAEVDPTSGKHDKKIILPSRNFGEGITVLNNKIYHLTYKEKEGFIYDADSYHKIGEFKYNTEGWGITHDNRNLIMSDGTEKLYFLDTTNLNVIRTMVVTDRGARVKNINELEYIDNYVFANIYETSFIVKIDPANGKVVGRIDLSLLANEIKNMYPNTYELNGIAYDHTSKALLVTGKFWPKSFLIRVSALD